MEALPAEKPALIHCLIMLMEDETGQRGKRSASEALAHESLHFTEM